MIYNTIKAIENVNNTLSDIGTIYRTEVNITNPGREWKIGAQLTLPPGTYMIYRRGFSVSESIIIGKGYSAGDFVSSLGENASACYTEVQHFDTETSIGNFILGNSDIYNGIAAVKIK